MISHAVVGVQRVDGLGFTPHHPARLLLRGDARRFAIRKIIRTPRVNASLPFGPAERPPSYDSVTSTANSVCARPLLHPLPDENALVNAAMTSWYQAARSEFSAIVGADLKFGETKFRM